MLLTQKDGISYYKITSENVDKYGLCCIKNKKAEGYKAKEVWIKEKQNHKLTIILAKDAMDKQIAFIEFISSENAWRPINAANYLFIQCIAVFSKKDRNNSIASTLIDLVLDISKKSGKEGVCTMTSKGVWTANKSLFRKNGFIQCDSKERFELMVRKNRTEAVDPHFIDWTKSLRGYKGWHLLYSDQCPWHIKSVADIINAAIDLNIEINVKRIESAQEAQNGPSGFGTFALIKDNQLLSDHYISATRFKTIASEKSKK